MAQRKRADRRLWCEVQYTINLGNYENAKVMVGTEEATPIPAHTWVTGVTDSLMQCAKLQAIKSVPEGMVSKESVGRWLLNYGESDDGDQE